MESVTHSRLANKASGALPRKASNVSNGGFQAQTMYEEVDGRPPNFGFTTLLPRAEDYSEIFSGFHATRASSIPVLDLPGVDETQVCLDVRSSGFNYAEIFGGFNGLDFGIFYEDLLSGSSDGRDGYASEEAWYAFILSHCLSSASEEAWTPADTGTSSEESEPYGNNPISSNEEHYKPFDGTTEFSISYHKANQTRNEVMSSGRTYVTELQAVHGYSLLYDETASSQNTYPELKVTDYADLCTNLRTAKMTGDRQAITKSQTADCNYIQQTLGNDLRVQKSLTRNSSCSSKDFVTVSEIALRTHPCQVQPPSRPPPPVHVRKEDSIRFSSNSMQKTCQKLSDDNSPPFFDVEIDVGLSASASACSIQEKIGKAQEKLGSVKQLAGKKEVPGGKVKPGLACVFNDNEGSTKETGNRLDDLDFEEPRCTDNRRHGRNKVSVNEGKIGAKITEEIHDSSEEDILLDISRRPAVEKHIEETFSSLQWSSRSTISGKHKGITQSSGSVCTQNFVNKSELPKKGQLFPHDMEVRECARMDRKAAIHEADSQVKTAQEIHHPIDYQRKHKAQIEVCQYMEITKQEGSADAECKKRDAKTESGRTGPSKKEKKDSKVRMVHNCVETEGETSQTNPCLHVQNMMKGHQVENKLIEGENWKKLIELEQQETENDLKLKEYIRKQGLDKCMDNMEGHGESARRRDRKQRKETAFYHGQVDDRERQKNAMDPAEKVTGLEESSEEDEEKCDKVYRNYIEQTSQNFHNQEQNENKSNAVIEKDENHKKSIEEMNVESPNVSLQNEEVLKGFKMKLHKEEREKLLTDTLALEENEKRVEYACESDENGNRVEEVDSCQTSKKEVSGSKRKLVDKETKENADNRCNDIASLEQKELNEVVKLFESNEEMRLNCARKIYLHGEYVELMVCDGAWTVEGHDNLLIHSASRHKQDNGKAEGSQDCVTDRECGKSGTDSEIRVNKLEAGILENKPADAQVPVRSIITEDIECGIFSENEAKIPFPFNGNLNNVSYTDICMGQMQNEEIENVRRIKNPEKQNNRESGGRQKNDQHFTNIVNKEEIGDELNSSKSEVNFENEFEIGVTESIILEGKENNQLPPQQCNLSQDTERKEKNLNYAPKVEKDCEMAREKELEIDHLRKLEEEREREREREREKDRMAVGQASLEGHGKARADTRERAERASLERAAAESRQRLLAEARERLEKACAEAKEKSFSDKVEAEARIKSDRATVERVTAEARERALDRAMAERAAMEAREQLERSVTADFATSLRNQGGKPSSVVSQDVRDEQFQSVGSRFPYSSTGASSFIEKSGEVEGESAKRCRARLERYRRTAEQVAKALAEKNMRDLLAQKEQAERNRLAETLDAEVKRWSSGKEGNLRALLSTLQYILGPNSGWQPIPLTEVITSAAVKKAYRKATLCVHPDKLQQRGGSIQHKYISEKVFDLLKDAWSKFNSEER